MAAAPRKITALAQHLPIGELRALELACGDAVHLEHFGPGSCGVDRDPAVLERLRERGFAAELRDLDEPGWSAGLEGFELVLAVDLLMHLERPEILWNEIARTLAPGAALVLCEWVFPERRGLRSRIARRMPGARAVLEHPEHLRVLDAASIETALGAAGLEPCTSYVHSFRSSSLARLVRPIWPPRTWIARRPQG